MIGKAYFEKLAENANPVFVKELRQNLRSRNILIFMSLMLLVLYGCTLAFTLSELKDSDKLGTIFFLTILFAGFFLSASICFFGSEQRFTKERADKELNYTLMTTLTPRTIILGKLESAMVMVPFIYSLLLPFMAAAFFMRGIPLESLLIIPFLIPILFLTSRSARKRASPRRSSSPAKRPRRTPPCRPSSRPGPSATSPDSAPRCSGTRPKTDRRILDARPRAVV